MLTVLVVDDSLVIRKVLSEMLEKLGHKVVGKAKNGRESIDLYEKLKPDLVTMDITMPIMSGIKALTAIRGKYQNAIVVMVTSHGEEKLVMDAISSGAKGFILKPLNEERIKNVIEKIFKK